MSTLSKYFKGILAKRLSAVESDTHVSNQHEFNGIRSMVDLFGSSKLTMEAVWLYLGEEEEDSINDEGFLTWYDAREQNPNRTEYRLYFQSNEVIKQASTGDLFVLAQRLDGSLISIVVKQGSSLERQILWLFSIVEINDRFIASKVEGEKDKSLGWVEKTILESIGVEVEQADDSLLEQITNKFGEKFPPTAIFSEFARNTIPHVHSVGDPDKAILAWIEQEEILFRTLEKHIVEKTIVDGFSDVDTFVKYSLTVQNRRKSRVGHALEHHIQKVLEEHEVSFDRGKQTENKSKPDFIFPSIESYHNDTFPIEKLTMLGAKTSCKDRWRQVLSEANKITPKHLFTLQAGISLNQTKQMQAKHLQLVLPERIQESYLPEQKDWLMNFGQFIELIRSKN